MATAVAEKLCEDGAGLRRRFEVAQGEPRSSAKASFQMPKEVRATLKHYLDGKIARRAQHVIRRRPSVVITTGCCQASAGNGCDRTVRRNLANPRVAQISNVDVVVFIDG